MQPKSTSAFNHNSFLFDVLTGPLPKSNNKDAIVIIADQFTKMIRLKATITAVSLEDICYNSEALELVNE